MTMHKNGTERIVITERQHKLATVVAPYAHEQCPQSLEQLEREIMNLPANERDTALKVMRMTINTIAQGLKDADSMGDEWKVDTNYPDQTRTRVTLHGTRISETITVGDKPKRITTKHKTKRQGPTMEPNGVVCNAQQPFNTYASRDGSSVNIAARPFN